MVKGNILDNYNSNLAIGFVIYKPADSFFQRIAILKSKGFKPFIYDNSPSLFLNIKEGLNYFTSGNNDGLGVGMNIICYKAFNQNYNCLLFFDQDTVFNDLTLETIAKFYISHKNLLHQSYTSVVFDSENYIINDDIDYNKYQDVLLSRNSGSLFILKNMKKIGWHNNNYFVDGVDYEYNLRSKINNFKIAKFSFTPGFDHNSEQGNHYKIIRYDLKDRYYSKNRIKDYVISNLRTLKFAILSFNFIFLSKLITNLIKWLFTQFIIRNFPIKKIKSYNE